MALGSRRREPCGVAKHTARKGVAKSEIGRELSPAAGGAAICRSATAPGIDLGRRAIAGQPL